jgi:predicted TIM-barrel fold metal-dependent hydrolase
MLDTVAERGTDARRAYAGGMDCDVHVTFPSTKTLLPYLDDYWREFVVVRGVDGLDLTSYPTSTPLVGRPDWRREGVMPGSDLKALQDDLLDPFGTDKVILNCVWGAQALYHEHLAAALCRAVNDWIVKEWLERDPRLRASIVVPWQNPQLAVEEIERRADDPRFVQVLFLCMGDMLLGRPHYWPVYEAAIRHRLPIGVHAGSAFRNAPTAIGWPSTLLEDHAANAPAFQSQLLSLVMEGVFTKYPDLTVVLVESGVTWLPALIWRATHIWQAMRMEVPWVHPSPAEIIRRNIRMTLQPFDSPPTREIVERVVEQIGTDEMLLFSTDYPHWAFDGTEAIPDGISPELARKILVDNPLRTYPRLSEALS